MTDLTQQEWHLKLMNDSNAVVLDVRTKQELAHGIIPDAIHIDFYLGNQFLEEIELLDKTKNYYVYCHSGVRSAQTCKLLNSLGIANAFNLEGGIVNWQGPIINSNL